MPLSGHISGGRAKGAKAHMSMQTVIFNKAALRGERKKKLGWACLQVLQLGCLFGVTIV